MTETVQESQPRAVRPGYRLGVVLRCALLAAIAFAAFALTMLLALDVEFVGASGGISKAADTAAGRLAVCIIPAAVACALLVGVGCAFIGIRASHKIAGPVYRLAADLSRIADGDRDFVVSTRDADQLKDLAAELELARAELDSRLSRVAECTRRLEDADQEISIDETKRRLSSLDSALTELIGRREGVS